jgi:hypothetical protein
VASAANDRPRRVSSILIELGRRCGLPQRITIQYESSFRSLRVGNILGAAFGQVRVFARFVDKLLSSSVGSTQRGRDGLSLYGGPACPGFDFGQASSMTSAVLYFCERPDSRVWPVGSRTPYNKQVSHLDQGTRSGCHPKQCRPTGDEN